MAVTTRRWIALGIAAPLSLALTLVACSNRSDLVRGSGTIEFDEVDVSSLVGGRIVRLFVDEGDTVAIGDTIAILDRGEVVASLAAQRAQAEEAEARWRDLRSGPRTPEIMAARETQAAAAATADIAERDFKRAQSVHEQHVISDAELDRARATRNEAVAKRNAASEQLRLMESGFRQQQIDAARRAADAARASLEASQSQARELILTSPIHGVVMLKNFRAGEVAAPGQAVVTLGNPDLLWMRIYVAAPELPRVTLGTPAHIEVRGLRQRFTGHVVEISPEAEFTPRSALTEDERANLVFGVKVRLDPTGGRLKPGLPADATISPGGAPGS